jgi:hypothetical protein
MVDATGTTAAIYARLSRDDSHTALGVRRQQRTCASPSVMCRRSHLT